MAREAKQEYRNHEDGAIALYRRPNSAMWYARCKLDDGVALNPFSTGTEDEREAVKVAKKRMLYAEVDRERGIRRITSVAVKKAVKAFQKISAWAVDAGAV